MTPLANTQQFEWWNGESGQRWVASADHRDQVLAPIADVLLPNARLSDGERVLDVGCGCGATTLAAAAAVGSQGVAVGADLSAVMLDVARQRAADLGCANVRFTQADLQTERVDGAFDVVISRFGTMFFDDPLAAFTNIAEHMSPAGRLCFATWQPLAENEWLLVPGAELLAFSAEPEVDDRGSGMFAQSDPTTITGMLRDAGLVDVEVEPYTVGLELGSTVDEAVAYLTDSGPGRTVMATIPEKRRPDAMDAVANRLGAYDTPERGVVMNGGILITTASAPSNL